MSNVRNIAYLIAILFCSTSTAAEPPITALKFSPEGDAVVIGSQAGVYVRSWPDLKQTRALATSMTAVHDLAFSPRGDVLAVVGGDPSEAGIIELFAWPSGDLIRRIEPHEDSIHAVAWQADSETPGDGEPGPLGSDRFLPRRVETESRRSLRRGDRRCVTCRTIICLSPVDSTRA